MTIEQRIAELEKRLEALQSKPAVRTNGLYAEASKRCEEYFKQVKGEKQGAQQHASPVCRYRREGRGIYRIIQRVFDRLSRIFTERMKRYGRTKKVGKINEQDKSSFTICGENRRNKRY